jgi:hypothetical protein
MLHMTDVASQPLVSPDGRFYWDGTNWRPLPTGSAGGPPVVAAMGALGPRRHAFPVSQVVRYPSDCCRGGRDWVRGVGDA